MMKLNRSISASIQKESLRIENSFQAMEIDPKVIGQPPPGAPPNGHFLFPATETQINEVPGQLTWPDSAVSSQ